ncbi:MAG: hypothetical protein M0R74_09100 [Dehalococcoidia bacterium]|jgi:alkylhydroperoxidase/carboxymuconolactone decarboxylase family protein YurZ|nr:hypothetical protein [Dehalococcoidia bacterium]
MQLDKLTSNDGIPAGLQRLAVLANKTVVRKKWSAWLETVPHATAQGRSLYTQTNMVTLSALAIEAGCPTVAHCYLTII